MFQNRNDCWEFNFKTFGSVFDQCLLWFLDIWGLLWILNIWVSLWPRLALNSWYYFGSVFEIKACSELLKSLWSGVSLYLISTVGITIVTVSTEWLWCCTCCCVSPAVRVRRQVWLCQQVSLGEVASFLQLCSPALYCPLLGQLSYVALVFDIISTGRTAVFLMSPPHCWQRMRLTSR